MSGVVEFGADAVDRYVDTLSRVTAALLVSDVNEAASRLLPVAGEVWGGHLPLMGVAGPGASAKISRSVSDRLRAQVFIRDRFRCTYCGGRAIPRSVLVAISDVFPDQFAYDAHYGHHRIHPAFWAVVPEADHTVPHSRGGGGDLTNLATLHTACNARKSDSLVADLPVVASTDPVIGWDGLIGSYPGIVLAGNVHGRRHSAAGYHERWLKLFGLQPLGPVLNPVQIVG